MDKNSKKFEILKKELLYDGFFKLESFFIKHTLFEGGWSNILKRELLKRPDCVAVIPYNPKTDKVVLIEQFRAGAVYSDHGPWLIEIIAGITEAGELAQNVAIREAHEEAGCQLSDLVEIGQFYTSPGGTSERITLFCGRLESLPTDGIYGLKDEDENILSITVSLDKALQYLKRGRIESAIPIVALQWLALHREQLKADWS